MTHEITDEDEGGGPERDDSLPDADSIPGTLSAADSDSPSLED